MVLAGLLGLSAVPASAATARSVSVKVSTTTPLTSASVTVSGTLTKSPKGTVVKVERKSGSRWVLVKSTRTTTSKGAYTTSIKAPATVAVYPYRTTVAKTSKLKAATSKTVLVEVLRRGTYARPTITTSSLPVTSRGSTYPVELKASEAGTWRLVNGTTLPRGLTMSSNGKLTGTVTAPTGDTVFTVRFSSSTSGRSANATLRIEVKPYIATKALPVAAADQPYSYALRTNGTISGTWSFLGGLPSGMSLDGATLHGTPAAGSSSTLFLTFTPTSSSYAPASTNLPFVVEGAMPSTASATTVDAGSQFACRVKSEDSSLWCWGYNLSGNLGLGEYGSADAVQTTPQAVLPGTTWRSVSTGGFFTACGIKTDASAWCWGQNGSGQVGDGTGFGADSPRRVASNGKTWSSIAAGTDHACAITELGALWCWGSNGVGALGVTTPTDAASTPVRVDTSTWKTVTASNGRTCGIKTDDTLWCWGQGQRTPAQVDAAGWSTVALGYSATCGIRTDGTLWCWGSNRSGQLGLGTTTSATAPTQVGTATTWRSVSSDGGSSGAATCGTQTDGSGWCWGAGESGQLGDGAARSSLVPVRVDATFTWSSISVGDEFACGVKNDGTQRCWGAGGTGQLGAGDLVQQSDVPVSVT